MKVTQHWLWHGMEDTITFLNVSQFQNDKQQILEADLNLKIILGKLKTGCFFSIIFWTTKIQMPWRLKSVRQLPVSNRALLVLHLLFTFPYHCHCKHLVLMMVVMGGYTIVNRPTRWSLWYWYLDVYVDHLYFQIQVTEKYSTAMC